jgi:hypothetical protein
MRIFCHTYFQSKFHNFLISTCFVISGKSSGLNSFGLMWCNGIILIPVPNQDSTLYFTRHKIYISVYLDFRTCLWTLCTVLDVYSGWPQADCWISVPLFSRVPGTWNWRANFYVTLLQHFWMHKKTHNLVLFFIDFTGDACITVILRANQLLLRVDLWLLH